MKKYNVLLLCGFLFTALAAQKPEKIYGGARQNKPMSYYKEQANAWKKEIDKNPKDANAWYNYYYAHRNLYFNDSTDKRSNEEKNNFMTNLVNEMGKKVPDSYEYNLTKWRAGGLDLSLLPYLKKAAKLGEGRTEHLDDMINISELERNMPERDMYCKKKFEANQFSTGIIYYNNNVLLGLEKNAIVFTSGDNDTYPAWYLQALGIRKDVIVINLSLLMLDDYRARLFNELGVSKWESVLSSSADYLKYKNEIVKHVTANTKGYPVYVALTTACHNSYTDSIEDKLYLTGLAYLYSKETVDNMAFLQKNVERVYAMDYIDKAFYQDISPDLVKIINGNYLIPLLKLYDHYKLSGDEQKKEWTKNKLIAISKNTDNEADVSKHLQQN